ncbi:MAG: OmpA family protein, partial [Sulfurimonas sp.]|nr:OmpA family protein [Sulfurimonas sp.]
TLSLSASEFKYIQPVAVEEAPVAKIVEEAPVAQAVESVESAPLDADKDGITDADDKCPNTIAGTKVDISGCELDSDNDGIVDSKDQCADTSKDFVVDGYGCPQTATLKVNFAPSKYNVSDELINDLQNFALFLKDNPGYQILIYGYTDSSGSVVANKKLSQNRANAVKEALSRYGIKSIRMTAIGKGEADPIADNTDKEGRAQNRRIEVELLQ